MEIGSALIRLLLQIFSVIRGPSLIVHITSSSSSSRWSCANQVMVTLDLLRDALLGGKRKEEEEGRTEGASFGMKN
ncbi:hypothetical protein BVC80_1733g14 [Macleaya cordata]|uniref:Uncharacterized protein n=1 Tax=Macleaya cordata TaxID=56857 RepID=A0A200Q8I4_MACCD|nr:hypothetical protein BVC80_1733g14 [Macleaya cordata]